VRKENAKMMRIVLRHTRVGASRAMMDNRDGQGAVKVGLAIFVMFAEVKAAMEGIVLPEHCMHAPQTIIRMASGRSAKVAAAEVLNVLMQRRKCA
tara:strand:- start:779 stop:1063 length:285 start_codon:yes stop_codon:yes gene_type:complete